MIDTKSLNSNGSASNNRPSSIININFKYPKISNLNEKNWKLISTLKDKIAL